YEYDPLGNLTVSTGAWANTNVWRFSTKPFDVASGLYYYGFRCYDPASGRWPNRDPIGEIDSQNLHCFAMNNPLSWVDPLGDKITSARCEAAKNSALNRNAKGKSLMRALRNKKCHIPQISCECCEGKNSGTFDPTSKNIKICYNKSPSEDHVIETVVHELIHAYDDCNGTNWGNCNERAFSEIRAVNLSGNCRRGGYYRGKNESYEGCVKRIAALSTKEDPACGDGTAAVSAVFNRCFQSPLR
ncbi:MAG: hypothetical protein LBS59_05155, partial [Puniceicoccales bacterium]|nr:hypothetical protein [Puniceicoccales bacterium]